MRDKIRDRDRLQHMIEAIDRILDFADGKTKEQLEADSLRYFGIIKNIEIVGEAAYKLTRAFCRQHPETPWEFIAKMRHVLVHDYYQINSLEVWKVVSEDLQPLKHQVISYLNDVNWEEWENNEQVIYETASHKSLMQTATRMKAHGYDTNEICKITGLSRDEIEDL